MWAFIVAAVVFLLVGVGGFVFSLLLLASLPAPSVQGRNICPQCWLIGGGILAVLIGSTHWLPSLGGW